MLLGEYNYDIHEIASDLPTELLPFDSSVVISRCTRTNRISFGDTYHDMVAKSESIQCYLRAHALRINTDHSGRHVVSVSAGTLSGNQFEVLGRNVIVAAGGLENPRILLLSNQIAPDGLGNDYGLVGRFFMEHLLFSGGEAVVNSRRHDYPIYTSMIEHNGGLIQATMNLTSDILRRERICDVYFQLRDIRGFGFTDSVISAKTLASSVSNLSFPDRLGTHIGHLIRDVDSLVDAGAEALLGDTILHDKPPLGLRVDYYGEQVPNPDSRVVLIDEKDKFGFPKLSLDWHISELDVFSTLRGHELLAAEMGRAGIGRMKFDLRQDDNPPMRGLIGGHHHMGTTRMSRDARSGVVYANCRVHGIDNLFIAGSSVFPTSGSANPTLTIVALAIRLADHLTQRQL